MVNRHAYMIMAHHRPDLLQLLLNSIDDYRNDIYVHIDQKSTMENIDFKVKKARLIFIERINVNWAGYSQVKCEYSLLKAAVSDGHHSYYHLLTGASYPLKSQNYIHQYFKENAGVEFVGFDNQRDYSHRARYIYLFSEYGKLEGIKGHLVLYLRNAYIAIQKILHIDRLRGADFKIKKGLAYFSITENLAKYVIDRENDIYQLLKNTLYADEVFLQTLVFNSRFINSVYNYENEYEGAARECAWPSCIGEFRIGCNFVLKDIEYLKNSNRIFALKFESSEGIELISTINQMIKNEGPIIDRECGVFQ